MKRFVGLDAFAKRRQRHIGHRVAYRVENRRIIFQKTKAEMSEGGPDEVFTDRNRPHDSARRWSVADAKRQIANEIVISFLRDIAAHQHERWTEIERDTHRPEPPV